MGKISLKQRYRQRFASHRTLGRLLLGFIVFLPISAVLFVATGTLVIFGIIPSLALGYLVDVLIFGTREERKRGAKFLGESLLIGAVVTHIFIWSLTGSLTIGRLDLGTIVALLIMYLVFGALVVFPVWKLRDWLKKNQK